MTEENAVMITTYLLSPNKWETPFKRRKTMIGVFTAKEH